MLEAMELCGNPSSVHAEGRKAHAVLETAREAVAAALGAEPRSVVFTSGGTEANNLAVLGAPVDRILVSALEHPSVIEPARRSGRDVAVIGADESGVIDLEELVEALETGSGEALVSVMLANNETGAIQPLDDAVRICRERGALVHTDGTQAAGKIGVSFEGLGIDLMTVSAHKLGGPMGVGALIVREGIELSPLVSGGGQELRRRAGTESLVSIAGFGAAIESAVNEQESFAARMTDLRDRLESELDALGAATHILGGAAFRLPNTSCFAIEGVGAELLLMGLDLEGVAVSSGSACSSGKVAPSHVLAAMGVDPELSRGAVRVSFGWNSTEADVDAFGASLKRVLGRLESRWAA